MSKLLKIVLSKNCALACEQRSQRGEPPITTPQRRSYISHFKEHFDLSFVDVGESVKLSVLPKPQDYTPHSTGYLDQNMAEPRARAARHKGQLNFGSEIISLLHAFGDVADPLSETVRVLDEIVTDFLIETCHDAAKTAAAAGRQKVKVEDFKFAIRGEPLMLGRVNELLALDRELKDARKHFDTLEGKVGLERGRKKKVDKETEMEIDDMLEPEAGPSKT